MIDIFLNKSIGNIKIRSIQKILVKRVYLDLRGPVGGGDLRPGQDQKILFVAEVIEF